MKNYYSILVLFFTSTILSAQEIVAGPMLGYNTMREIAVWVQVDKNCELNLQFWPTASPEKLRKSEVLRTQSSKGYTATLVADLLEPGTEYSFRILANGSAISTELNTTTQNLWQWRTAPPDFDFLTGSCMYINEPAYDRPGSGYGGEYEILTTMSKENAEFMMWLGDNTYLREVDWDSRAGIYHRNSHTRRTKELQPLLSKMHHYAIWDDHDYGNNDSDWTFWNKDITREAFEDFWANPNYGVVGLEGITGTFSWNDCQFFLLDNRWYRNNDFEKGSILGKKQRKWLIDALRQSRASYKFICVGGQFLSDCKVFENHANFENERQKIINLLDKYNQRGVIFLTGDRHHSEISKLETDSGDIFYDVTTSPITSGSYDHSDEKNTYRLEGTIIPVRSYAHISVSGEYGERRCVVEFKDANGKTLVTQDLSYKKKEKK